MSRGLDIRRKNLPRLAGILPHARDQRARAPEVKSNAAGGPTWGRAERKSRSAALPRRESALRAQPVEQAHVSVGADPLVIAVAHDVVVLGPRQRFHRQPKRRVAQIVADETALIGRELRAGIWIVAIRAIGDGAGIWGRRAAPGLIDSRARRPLASRIEKRHRSRVTPAKRMADFVGGVPISP